MWAPNRCRLPSALTATAWEYPCGSAVACAEVKFPEPSRAGFLPQQWDLVWVSTPIRQGSELYGPLADGSSPCWT